METEYDIAECYRMLGRAVQAVRPYADDRLDLAVRVEYSDLMMEIKDSLVVLHEVLVGAAAMERIIPAESALALRGELWDAIKRSRPDSEG